MRLRKKITLFLFLLLAIFIAYTLVSTGFFRTIERKFEGELIKKIPIKGAEDIMVSLQDSFVLISATDRANREKKAVKDGGLFLIDLKSDNYTPISLTSSMDFAFEPHGISFLKKDTSYLVMAINHANDIQSLEVFELVGKQLIHKKTLKDPFMVHPNDLVMIDENRFYFTNDHRYTKGVGLLMEDYLGLAISNVVYFDGTNYKEVAGGIAYANGINFDKKRNLMFVASPRHFSVKVYTKETDGSLTFIEDIPCGTGVDNIEFDEENNLWIGAHPNLLRFKSYWKGNKPTTPSEVIKISYHGKGDYKIDQIYMDDGAEMSGSTVAAIFKDLIFMGNVMDEHFLVLKKK